jgi:hypothetical protein
VPSRDAPFGRIARTNLAELIKNNEAKDPGGEWQAQLSDTLGALLAAIKASAMYSDLQSPEVTAALTQAFTQLVEANLLLSRRADKASNVTPLKATG